MFKNHKWPRLSYVHYTKWHFVLKCWGSIRPRVQPPDHSPPRSLHRPDTRGSAALPCSPSSPGHCHLFQALPWSPPRPSALVPSSLVSTCSWWGVPILPPGHVLPIALRIGHPTLMAYDRCQVTHLLSLISTHLPASPGPRLRLLPMHTAPKRMPTCCFLRLGRGGNGFFLEPREGPSQVAAAISL